MKFRHLLTAISVFTALSVASLCLAAQPEAATAPTVFVKGLLMLQLEQQDGLHIALPDAPGHRATITFVMKDGKRSVVPFKGRSTIRVSNPNNAAAVVKVPELLRMKELYGSEITPLLDRSPNNISIPWSSIRAVRTEDVTDSRYTFVRKDSGEEIETFRPRQIAETIRIELNPLGALDFNPIKTDIDLATVKEIWIEQTAKDNSVVDVYKDHFHHYLHYVGRPANKNFDVEPRKLSAAAANYGPRVGNAFWVGATVLCPPVAID